MEKILGQWYVSLVEKIIIYKQKHLKNLFTCQTKDPHLI